MKHDQESIEGYEGLYRCRVCGSAEGEQPTECPGVPMTTDQKDSVMSGLTDFRETPDGPKWVLTVPGIRWWPQC